MAVVVGGWMLRVVTQNIKLKMLRQYFPRPRVVASMFISSLALVSGTCAALPAMSRSDDIGVPVYSTDEHTCSRYIILQDTI